MPVIKNFGGRMPDAIFQPNVFIQGASPELLPWGLILLDTGYSKDLALNAKFRPDIGVPKGEKVALKIVLPTAELVESKSLERIDASGKSALTIALNVERKDMLCVDQALADRGGTYNVISIGFARDLNQMLLVKNKPLGPITHPHFLEYKKYGGLEVLLPEVTLRSDAQAPPFHKELNVEWRGHQPYVTTIVARTGKDPVTFPILWDTGADVNTCPESLWGALKGRTAKIFGQNGFIMDEVIGVCTDDTQLVFRDIPFFHDDSITIGAPLISMFPEIGLGPKFTVLLPG
jgi:hypothetical protein